MALAQIDLDAADVNLEEVVRLGAHFDTFTPIFATQFAAAEVALAEAERQYEEVLADANRPHQ